MNLFKKLASKAGIALFAVVFLSTLIAAPLLTPSSAYADGAYVTLSAFSGHPGVTLTVSGGGFFANDAITVAGGIGAYAVQTSTTADANGNFSATLTVPANTPQGPFAIVATSASRNQASNSYYVNPFAPTVSSVGASHAPYSTIVVSGSGFSTNEKVTIELAGTTLQATADASGSFSNVSLTIPAVRSDLYLLNATGNASGAHAIEYFYIDGLYPNISPSAYYILPGATLSFNGSGFAAGETIKVTAGTNSTVLSTFTANSAGSFTNAGGFAVPFNLGGTTAEFNLAGQTSGAKSSVSVTVGSFFGYASPSSYYLTPGASVAFNGGGFGANETLNVTLGTNSTVISTITTDQNGGFANAGTTTVPFSAAGKSLVFNIVGSNSHATAQASLAVGSFYPTISPTNYYIAPNGSTAVVGSGFAPNETITISLDGVVAGTAQTSVAGTFSTASIHLPYTGKGSATLTAIGSLSQTVSSVQVTVGQFYPTVTPSAYYTFPGETLGLTGSGFAANENVTISQVNGSVSTVVGTSTTDALGNLNYTGFKVPFTSTGALNLIVTGTISQVAVNANIALGARYVYLDSSSYYAQQGSTITISGSGFIGGETVDVITSAGVVKATATTLGSFTAPITLPFGTTGVKVTATGETSGATANLTIGLAPFAGQITPSTWYTTAGTAVTFTGSGFAPSESVAIYLNGTDTGTAATTNSLGAFTQAYTIPFSATAANFEFKSSKTKSDIIIPITLAVPYASFSFNNYYGNGGSAIIFQGSGFVPGETVNFATANGVFASTVATADGSFTYSTTVPYAPAGQLAITATGATSGRTNASQFTVAQVYTSIQLGSYAGAPGEAVTFIGSGYLPNEPIQIFTDKDGSAAVATFNADANGSFTNAGYIVPTTYGGPLTLTIKGTHSFDSKTITYYVTGM